jgi:Secretion system C-terminal sorting domain
VKIIKGDSTTAAGVVNDVIRMWASPTAPAKEADLSATGDATVIQTRVLRGDNNTFCTVDGITGLRIRVEGAGNNAFCAEFDEIRLGTTFSSVVPATSPVKDIAADFVHSKLTPNPTFDKSTFHLTIKQGGYGDVGVYDFSGKRLSTVAQGHFTEGERQVDIPTNNLAAGVYFVRIAVEGAVRTEKLTVMK